MAETAVPAPTHFNQDGAPPLSYIIAMWLGMPHDEILRGLRDGSVAPPPGAPQGWLPPWANEDIGDTGDNGAIDSAGTLNGDGQNRTDSDGRGIINVDRSAIQHWFNTLDPGLSTEAFGTIWQKAGADDVSRAGALFGYLRRVLLGSATDVSVAQTRQDTSDGSTSDAAALTAYLADAGHQAHVVDLDGKDGAELAQLAHTDVGYRYALAHLDPIALTGNRALFADENADGSLDRFDPDTGEQNLTDSWLADRAKFLAWKMKVDGGDDAAITGNDEWVFVDRTLRDASGNPMKLEIAAADGATRTNQVIFGADTADGEMLKGGTGTDRIYGGNGDDVVRGNAGDDHLEGGRGDDLVIGGNGNDEVIGGRGSDELEGGAGADLLRGGSGDDTLSGGGGADRMEGGDGHDTYVLDPGDGADAIADSDGDGEVQFDGAALAGANASSDGRYVSTDGRAIYSFDGDLNESGTLTISFYASDDPGANDAPINTVRIENWRNGDLGIRLGGGVDTSGGTMPDATSDASAPIDAGAASSETPNDAPALPEVPTAGGEAAGVGAAGAIDAADAADGTTAAAVAAPDDSATVDSIAPDLAAVPGAGAFAGAHSAAALVNADIVSRAVQSFAGVPEAPDITAAVHAADTTTVGVTPQDVSNAMLDFHDASDLAHDQAGSEPLPAPMATLVEAPHSGSIAGAISTAGVVIGNGTGQRAG